MEMAYTLENVPSPNQTYDPARAAPTGIVIHHWGDDGQSHDGVVAHLTNRNGGTSSHYVVSAGRVTCLVDPLDTAWHAGVWPVNYQTIGIECRPEMSAGDFQTVAECIAWLRGRFGNLPLSGHRDHYATACPGRWYPRLADLSAAADAIRTGATHTTPTQEDEGEAPMRFVRSVQTGTIYAVTPLDVSAVKSAALWGFLTRAYDVPAYEDMHDGEIGMLVADAAARRARILGDLKPTNPVPADVDEDALAKSLAALIPDTLATQVADILAERLAS